jgi:F420H(2)-dependent quinone reductase
VHGDDRPWQGGGEAAAVDHGEEQPQAPEVDMEILWKPGTAPWPPARRLNGALGTVQAVTVTGRLANLASRNLGPVARAQGRLHVQLYRRFGGRRWTRWLGRPVFCLTVPGRVTGEPRSVMLMLVRRGDDLLVCGSNGGHPTVPNWYRNLVAAGEGTVTVGPDSWLVTAREVDGQEREECWRLLCEGYPDFRTYQALTERRLPVAVLERAVTLRRSRSHSPPERAVGETGRS